MLVCGSLSGVTALLESVTNSSEASSQSSIGRDVGVVCNTIQCQETIHEQRSGSFGMVTYDLLASLEDANEASRDLAPRYLPDDRKKPILLVIVLL